MGKQWKQRLTLFFWASKLLQPWNWKTLASWKKSYNKPRQPIKKRHHLVGNIVKAVVFTVLMYRCESWTIKNAEYRRIDAFKLWCWRRLLRLPWTARRSNQSILKEINPEYSLDGLMLKLQYSDHLNRKKRADSFEKTLTLGKSEGRKRRGQKRMRWLDGITESMDMSLSKLWSWWWAEKPGVLQSMGSQRFGQDWATELTASQHWEARRGGCHWVT